MTRDFTTFPDDENGDVLWRMKGKGDDLSKRRQIDLSVVFPTEDAAMAFAVRLLRDGQTVSFGPYEGNNDLPWEVTAHPVILPTHANISDYESKLASSAEELGGRNDGWGCFQQ
jgi:hypothetical protein